jgi:hypothetical protein
MKKVGKAEMTCANCWYSQPAQYKREQLECHIFPPEIKEAEQSSGMVTCYSVWPAVSDDMWCGEWTRIGTEIDKLSEKVRKQSSYDLFD